MHLSLSLRLNLSLSLHLHLSLFLSGILATPSRHRRSHHAEIQWLPRLATDHWPTLRQRGTLVWRNGGRKWKLPSTTATKAVWDVGLFDLVDGMRFVEFYNWFGGFGMWVCLIWWMWVCAGGGIVLWVCLIWWMSGVGCPVLDVGLFGLVDGLYWSLWMFFFFFFFLRCAAVVVGGCRCCCGSGCWWPLLPHGGWAGVGDEEDDESDRDRE